MPLASPTLLPCLRFAHHPYLHNPPTQSPPHLAPTYTPGNVEEVSGGFVRYFDLTMEGLQLPRADWVMALEVAEHIPNGQEQTFVRNVHAHNW